MLRWGILSTGTIAKKFAETLNGMKGEAVFAAAASRDIEKAKAFAKEYGAAAAFGSYEEMAASSEIDAVYIATPNVFHFEHALLCLDGGKHVLCEKPFTTNAEDARKLYDTAKAKNLLIMDGLWTMHLPMYAKIRRLISEGAIGEVRHIRAEFGFAPSGVRKDFKLDPSLGGGSLLDVGIYNIGFAAMVLGTNPASIQAHLNICGYGTDDLAGVLLSYPCGTTAALTSSIGARMPVEGVIFGSQGLIHLPNYQMATIMTLHPQDGEPVEYKMPFDINGFEYQIREFTKCVSQGLLESSRLSPEFSIGIIQIMDDIRKACGLKFSFEN
ncbi:MAG: Gfo/Idh/MocA family oxidoreductase [Defluviitaleaceae bacterium]|nr:Gfo/Idh/MocA family oxidoreductase [Defluviitaleaceae bacterium]